MHYNSEFPFSIAELQVCVLVSRVGGLPTRNANIDANEEFSPYGRCCKEALWHLCYRQERFKIRFFRARLHICILA